MKQAPQIVVAKGCGVLVVAAAVAVFLAATDTRGAGGWILILALFAAPFIGLKAMIRKRLDGGSRPPREKRD